MDEDDGFVFGEDDVGFAGEVFAVEAEAVAHAVEGGTDDDFGFRIAVFNTRHVP